MTNLVDPRDAKPATTDERAALCDVYHALGGSSKAGRRAPVRPVPIDRLTTNGLAADLLTWLLFQGHIDHFQEIIGRRGAKLSTVESAVAAPKSSFSLTPTGLAFAARFLAAGRVSDAIALPMGRLTPCYQLLSERRILSWGAHTLKTYIQEIGNQEKILATAEELGWVAFFDDPLPGPVGKQSKARLHRTIADLNRHQQPYLVHFTGHGHGTRIGWELRRAVRYN